MKHIIGVDQGSTKTHAAIADSQGHILAVVKTQGADHHKDGIEIQSKKIGDVCERLIKEVEVDRIDLIYAGLTGIDWPGEDKLLANGILKLGICNNITVVSDSIIALRGGTSKPYGGVIIAGTGANCALISPEGKTFNYSYVENAIQGGHALGKLLFDTVAKALMCRIEPTSLTERLSKRFNNRDILSILKSYTMDEYDFNTVTSLAEIFFEEAKNKDEIANKLLRDFGKELATLLTSRIEPMNMDNISFEAVLSGSLFKGDYNPLREAVEEEIHRRCPKVLTVAAKYEPIVGSIFLGLEQIHGKLNNRILENIEKSCEKYRLYRH